MSDHESTETSETAVKDDKADSTQGVNDIKTDVSNQEEKAIDSVSNESRTY